MLKSSSQCEWLVVLCCSRVLWLMRFSLTVCKARFRLAEFANELFAILSDQFWYQRICREFPEIVGYSKQSHWSSYQSRYNPRVFDFNLYIDNRISMIKTRGCAHQRLFNPAQEFVSPNDSRRQKILVKVYSKTWKFDWATNKVSPVEVVRQPALGSKKVASFWFPALEKDVKRYPEKQHTIVFANASF